jgi:hypothetical protein
LALVSWWFYVKAVQLFGYRGVPRPPMYHS